MLPLHHKLRMAANSRQDAWVNRSDMPSHVQVAALSHMSDVNKR